MFPLRSSKPDPVSLDGLEDLLDRPQLEVVDNGNSINTGFSAESSGEINGETELILTLLNTLSVTNFQLEETASQLNATMTRVNNLASVIAQQNKELTVLTKYKEQAALIPSLEQQILDLKRQLKASRRPWWQKVTDSAPTT